MADMTTPNNRMRQNSAMSVTTSFFRWISLALIWERR
jgi:hypothetical protein